MIRTTLYRIFFFVAFFSFNISFSQVNPTKVSKAVYFDKIGPVSELPPGEVYTVKLERNNLELNNRTYPNAANSLPTGDDPVRQKSKGVKTVKGTISNFNGLNSSYYPSDCNGAAGKNYFLQTVNTKYTIFDKSGNQLLLPTAFSTLFQGVTGNGNDGDPVVIYDDQADRWFVSEFSISGETDYMLIAVSETDDPLGVWYRWSFEMTGMPDYMKFGVWRDGYYMATNTYYGNDIYVFERDEMLIGSPSPQMVQFNNPWRPGSGFHCVQPLDNDGMFASENSPGLFITINDDAWSGSDELWIYECEVDWQNPGSSTFNRTQQVPVAPFDSNFGSWSTNLDQPGTSQKIDAIPLILMYRAQYRNFNSYETIVCCHTVDVDATNHAGIRWYELRNTGSSWEIRQQGTYAPDEHSRFMGSIAMNSRKEIALGYSITSSTEFPGLRYCGQSSEENDLASGILDISEEVILSGTNSQQGYSRWGDYSLMSVDPFDDLTFWYTGEYYNGSPKGTMITGIQFSDPDYPGNVDATALNETEILLTWDMNASGDPILLAWSETDEFGVPENGTSYNAGDQIPGGGIVLTSGQITDYLHSDLTANTEYFYTVWSSINDNSEYSEGVPVSELTQCGIISEFPWNEGFEFGGYLPNCLSQEYVSGDDLDWQFVNGNSFHPETAHSGTYFSLLKDQDEDDDKSILILPALNFGSANNAVLSFWNIQSAFFDWQDELRVLYKTSSSENWSELANYTNSIEEWTKQSILLPNISYDYYIAFEGNAKFGRGVCIDDIQIDINVSSESDLGKNIEIFPNPSRGVFKIYLNKNYKFVNVNVCNISGKTVYGEVCENVSEIKLNLKDPASGLYIVHIIINDQVISKKIVIK